MNIDTTTEKGQHEASRMLARLMPDWTVTNDWQITTPEGYGLRNLYAPANMAMAWRVLNWAAISKISAKFSEWWYEVAVSTFHHLEPNVAQRAWLDKILTLAIDAGMIPKESRT